AEIAACVDTTPPITARSKSTLDPMPFFTMGNSRGHGDSATVDAAAKSNSDVRARSTICRRGVRNEFTMFVRALRVGWSREKLASHTGFGGLGLRLSGLRE